MHAVSLNRQQLDTIEELHKIATYYKTYGLPTDYILYGADGHKITLEMLLSLTPLLNPCKRLSFVGAWSWKDAPECDCPGCR